MISPVPAYVYADTVDMRIGFDRLASLVREQMNQSPRAAALFVFIGRQRDRAKILWHDGTGYCVLAKRLDSGRFASIKVVDSGTKRYVVLNAGQLQELLAGTGQPAHPGGLAA